MITFADSHVDLMGNVTFTGQQLMRRWDAELNKKWSREVQDNLRDFMQLKPDLDPLTFPNYDQNEALRVAFITDKQICYQRRIADEAKNAKLISAIEYEQAVQRKAALELAINGRVAVDEVPEVKDPDTGEVTQEFVPAVTAVEPMATTIEQIMETGTETVANPAYTQAVSDLAHADAVIAGASAETLALVSQRAAA